MRNSTEYPKYLVPFVPLSYVITAKVQVIKVFKSMGWVCQLGKGSLLEKDVRNIPCAYSIGFISFLPKESCMALVRRNRGIYSKLVKVEISRG